MLTAGLLLRRWCATDLAPFAAINADPRVMQHMPACLTRGESDAAAARYQAHIDQYGFGLWALEREDTGAFIGFVGLNRPRFEAHFTPCVKIGWRLAFDQSGQGFVTEASAGVTDGGSRRWPGA